MPLERRSHPGTKRSWTHRSAARPEELRQAALRLFGERGYAATTIEDIATAAGVTVGTVYRYFTDKAALLSELVGEAQQVPLLLGETIAEATASPDSVGSLRSVLGRLWTMARTDPHRGVLRILVADGGSFPDLVEAYREQVLEPATRELEILIQRAGGSDPLLAARATLGHLLGAALLATGPAGRRPLVSQPAPLEFTVEQLLTGVLARCTGLPTSSPALRALRSPDPSGVGRQQPRPVIGPDAW